ncbi:MAG: hypothetical protein PHR06_08790 [Candidatus Cloacimonetes bacterium]|nr:hypothetical protein [Candidatus Cloacimonadota bacterium]
MKSINFTSGIKIKNSMKDKISLQLLLLVFITYQINTNSILSV